MSQTQIIVFTIAKDMLTSNGPGTFYRILDHKERKIPRIRTGELRDALIEALNENDLRPDIGDKFFVIAKGFTGTGTYFGAQFEITDNIYELQFNTL